MTDAEMWRRLEQLEKNVSTLIIVAIILIIATAVIAKKVMAP